MFECDPCVEPGPREIDFFTTNVFDPVHSLRGGGEAWYPGAWVVNMGGNGRAITVRPAENIFHIAASTWNVGVKDGVFYPEQQANPNWGIAGWNQSARACTGYNDQHGNTQQYCSVWEQVNGTYQGNYRNRTWEAWNPEGLNGTNAQYNSSVYTPEQCERWSDILAWDANANGARLENMLTSLSGAHGCGCHRYGIDPWRVKNGEVWTLHAGKVCPGTARVNQLDGIIQRAIVIRDAVRAGRCGYLPRGRVDLVWALARTGNVKPPINPPITEDDDMPLHVKRDDRTMIDYIVSPRVFQYIPSEPHYNLLLAAELITIPHGQATRTSTAHLRWCAGQIANWGGAVDLGPLASTSAKVSELSPEELWESLKPYAK